MAQLFHPAANGIARLTLYGAAIGLLLILGALFALYRSAFATGQHTAREQPVLFSHEHHVAGIGLDCRYCHLTAETGPFAGLPTSETCMGCHAVIWRDSPMLEPVRESWRTGRPLAWTRVYDLPDFVAFDHSIHVAKGIGCETCHGRIDQMGLTFQATSLLMTWCLDCHRAPERFIRPRSEVFTFGWTPPADPDAGRRLVGELDARPRTSCSTCHR